MIAIIVLAAIAFIAYVLNIRTVKPLLWIASLAGVTVSLSLLALAGPVAIIASI